MTKRLGTPNTSTGERQYRKHRARFRARCEELNAPCHLCGRAISYDLDDGTDPDSFELDHFHPRSTHPELMRDVGNFRPAHSACNRSRGTKPVVPTLGTPSEAW
ncbi:HNH endonuclease [Gordonia sp. CPCC 205333]|uniref:HNH endonuclease n=1 Tax=Gordonia sp. CPCC 205333 TaxID=3140790 RepID=UPI003AF40ABC